MILVRKKEVWQWLQNQKEGQKNETRVDEVELEDSEGEEDTLIKWQDDGIESVIAIRGEMEEEIAKSTKKSRFNFHLYNMFIEVYLIQSKCKSLYTNWAN